MREAGVNGSLFASLRAAFDAREGLRGALACAPVLVLGWALHEPGLSWATIGAFWTTLAAVSGPARQRIGAMLAFGALSSLCGGFAASLAGLGSAVGTLAVFAAAGAAGLARMRAPRYYQVALLSAAACVLMLDQPATGHRDYAFLAHYAGGCLYAAAVGAFVWWRVPPKPDAPEPAAPVPSSHFALVLGFATAASYLGVHLFHVRFGYWATIAVLLILRPSAADTWPRSLERALGTGVGAALALGLGLVARSPLVIALAVLPLIGLAMALRKHSYRVFVALLTPAIILVADFGMPLSDHTYAFARIEDNLIGSVIAFAASLLLQPLSVPSAWANAAALRLPRPARPPKVR